MTDVNEQIVRTYFQLKGYLVHPNLKYMVHWESGSGESDIDLAINNSKTGDKAIVEVKGWHNDYFTKSYFEEDPEEPNEIFNFVRKEALEKAKDFFGTEDFRKILVISEFGPGQREECMEIINEKGVDEVLEFHEILSFVIDRVEPNKNYRDSEFLQTVRLLKAYEFLRMENKK